MRDLATLLRQKEDVRERIFSGEWPDVTGVAVDRKLLRLIVFSVQKDRTRNSLANLFGESADDIILRSGEIDRGGERRPVRVRITRHIDSSGLFILPPASPIEPVPGERGVLGCFVALASGEIGALTVRHCFYNKSSGEPFNICEPNGKCATSGGKSVYLVDLSSAQGAMNDCDCALVDTDNKAVLPVNDGTLSGDFVSSGNAPAATNADVVNLSSGSQYPARVIDIDCPATYPVVLGNKDGNGNFIYENVKIDHQILVQGSGFGVPGQSGSPVVMTADEPKGSFRAMDILGLYSEKLAECDYHYLTPLFSCMSHVKGKLKKEGILLPPASERSRPHFAVRMASITLLLNEITRFLLRGIRRSKQRP